MTFESLSRARIGSLLDPRAVLTILSADKKGKLTGYVEGLIDKGLNHIEITGDTYTFLPENLVQRYRDEVKDGLLKLKEERSITFSCHFPIVGGIDLSTSIAPIRNASIEVIKKIIDEVSHLEPVNYVLHIVGMLKELGWTAKNPITRPILLDPMLERAVKAVEEIAAVIGKERLCIENMEAMPFDLHAEIVEATGVRICLDVGHYMISQKEGGDISGFLDSYSDKIGHIHVHSAIKKTTKSGREVIEDHRGLNVDGGMLDFDGFMTNLGKTGYDGPVVLEVLRDNMEPSIEILAKKMQPEADLCFPSAKG